MFNYPYIVGMPNLLHLEASTWTGPYTISLPLNTAISKRCLDVSFNIVPVTILGLRILNSIDSIGFYSSLRKRNTFSVNNLFFLLG